MGSDPIVFVGNKVYTDSYCSFIPVNDINPFRINPEFYSPELLKNERLLNESNVEVKNIGEVSLKLSDGTHETIKKLGGYKERGVRLIRSNEIENGLGSSAIFISAEAHERNKRSEVLPLDILIAVRGSSSVGISSVYPDDMPAANINTAVARIRLKQNIDQYWVSLFLNSKFGRLGSLRIANGVNQLNMNMDEVGRIPVLLPRQEIQEAIGNKVRKAERLRNLASLDIQSANSKIDDLYGLLPNEHDFSDFGWRSMEAVDAIRLDGWYHRPFFVSLEKQLRNHKGLHEVGEVCNLISDTADLHSWKQSNFDYFEIGGIDIETGKANASSTSTQLAPSRAKYLVRRGDILVSTVRPNLKAVGQIDPDYPSFGVATSGFCVLRPPTTEIGAYVRACLVHEAATQQMVRWNSGGTYPAIDREVPCRVLIPYVVDIADFIGKQLLCAFRAIQEARELVYEAQKALEMLLADELDESKILAESEIIEKWLSENPSVHTMQEA